MKTLRLLILVAGVTLVSAEAGTRYDVTCGAPKCGFSTTIDLGGGRLFEQESAWCRRCGKTVSTTWKRDSKRGTSFAQFWDALTGRERKMFDCPGCGSLVVAMEEAQDFKHCPKCGKPSLKHKVAIMFD